MNILFVAEHYKHNVQGGGEINLALLCEALVEHGHEVHVLTSFVDRKHVEVMNGVYAHCVAETGAVDTLFGNVKRSLFFPRSIMKELKQLLSQHHFDIVHLIGSTLQLAPSIKRSSSLPVVATIESYLALCPKGDFLCGEQVDIRPWNFLTFVRCVMKSKEIGKLTNRWYMRYNPLFWIVSYRRYLQMRDGLFDVYPLAVSHFVASLLNNFYGIESTVIPNFVDVELFKSVKPIPNRKPVVLYLGSLTRYKGLDVLLKAAKGLDCSVKIYGSGPLKSHVLYLIQKNHIHATIHEPVSYAKIPLVYADADLVVFPSLWPEPFGRIAIEAMAARKPIIGSDIGGISETLMDVGILVKPGDVAQMRSALQKLLENIKLRERIAQNAAKNVLSYSKENVLEQLIGVYKIIISGKS